MVPEAIPSVLKRLCCSSATADRRRGTMVSSAIGQTREQINRAILMLLASTNPRRYAKAFWSVFVGVLEQSIGGFLHQS
ncbi:hypothetical protein [Synechococcus sp. BIOS-E4-1]|uniref:hypothetical protein n=1 Tax=Synechococcus sp. BIOS-E4-1 TaxID=1400864 RepID=UPI001CA40169|nr:hypothetical protein [Synechococcus sp. BIOS-E4-1]